MNAFKMLSMQPLQRIQLNAHIRPKITVRPIMINTKYNSVYTIRYFASTSTPTTSNTPTNNTIKIQPLNTSNNNKTTLQPNLIVEETGGDQIPEHFIRRVCLFFGFWVVVYIGFRVATRIQHLPRDIDLQYKSQLSESDYNIVRLNHNEMPHTGKYVNFWHSGIYKCKCCGLPLFTSEYKFDSGYGWATFAKCIDHHVQSRWRNIQRVELDCTNCQAHIGTIWGDGPPEYNHLRYNVSSAALEFESRPEIPASKFRYTERS